ncbi:hypothetical protein QCM77_30280 [Bradyrhizobium sp. SSUT18]|uniref:hypothetical protein n=1 Tax=Bradyrhizobium sp. SSUT18 TaxID=3040602 RepID=UPI00244B9C33|nr:hypothetical protein [Bradyrhizobium sp. SSUT18]MDH2404208.1 hypothetical protein [Bradyrhizobium sp. SSUT18]
MAKINQQSNMDLLINNFPTYILVFEHNPPFAKYGQLEHHVETIRRRRELGSATEAIFDNQFLKSLYLTLGAWGIGVRASKLKSFDAFVSALQAKGPEIAVLEKAAIDDPKLDPNATGRQLWLLIDGLDIVENNTPIVAGSKALHHVLPDLMVPIDRAYTQKFFCWQNPTFQYEQRSCFGHAFVAFTRIARKTTPNQYISNGGWHSSTTKIIDNAIVGLIRSTSQSARG